MTRALMIGLGGVGQRHARNLRAILGDHLDLIAYRSRGLDFVVTSQLAADSSQTIEDAYSIRSFRSLEEALGQKPNFAVICNPSSLHVEVAQQCADAGCDLFLEKPLAADTAGVDNLIATVRKRDLVGMVGYQLRYHPSIIKLREIVESGVLGNLLGVRAAIGEYLPLWHPYEDYRQMYASRADLGGGVILSQIHEFDYLYSLFGMPSQIWALGGHWSHLEIDVEDAASILMQFEVDGRPLPVHLHQDYLQNPPTRTCEVVGDRGKVIANVRELSVTLQMPDLPATVFNYSDFDRNQMFLSEMRHFLECATTRRDPDVTLEDGLNSLRMALAAKESIATGRTVAVGKES